MEPLSVQRSLDKTGKDPGRAMSFRKRLCRQFLTPTRRWFSLFLGGWAVVVVGWLIGAFWFKGAGSVIVETGAVIVIFTGFVGLLSLVLQLLYRASIATQVMIGVMTSLFVLLSQVVLAAIASSGDPGVIGAVLHGNGVSAVWSAFGFIFVFAIPAFVVAIPEALRQIRPWDEAADLAKTLVPAWLAAAAAAATFLYVFVQYFFGAALAHRSLPAVLVGGLGTAALLAPVYQFMARSCWEYGVGAVLDPVRWLKTWREVSKEALWDHLDAFRQREDEKDAEQVVATYRKKAAARPDRYRPDLGGALLVLGGVLWGEDRPDGALPVTREAVETFRKLAAADPDRYRPDLAAALSLLGAVLSDLDRQAEALPVRQEAVATYRKLAAADPDQYRPDLANALSLLGTCFWDLGLRAEALPVMQGAVATYRKLAAADPDQYRPDLALNLKGLAAIHQELGQNADADSLRAEAAQVATTDS